MRAVIYERPGSWQVADVPDPIAGPGEVVLEVLLCGVCGTDVHLDRGEFGPLYPLTPGHEIVATVIALGEGVVEPAPGTVVALDNMTACGMCRECRAARPQLCAHMTALGVNRPGGFAQRVVAPAGKCHPVGELAPEVAVFAEPLSCVVHGMDVLDQRVGSDVLVLGTGPTGLLMGQLLAATGAGRVTIAGRQPAKLELARSFGADHTVTLSPDPASWAAQLHGVAPDGFDVVIDATGAVDVLTTAIGQLGIGGTLLVYGMTEESATLAINPYDLFRRELTIRGSFSQAFAVGRAVTLLQSGRVRTEGLISLRTGLDGYGGALEAVANDRSCIKAVLEP